MWPVDARGAQRLCVINLTLYWCGAVVMSDAVVGSYELGMMHFVYGDTIITHHGSLWGMQPAGKGYIAIITQAELRALYIIRYAWLHVRNSLAMILRQ